MAKKIYTFVVSILWYNAFIKLSIYLINMNQRNQHGPQSEPTYFRTLEDSIEQTWLCLRHAVENSL